MSSAEDRLHRKEIQALKHVNKLKWIDIYTNPSTYFLIMASMTAIILIGIYFKWEWKDMIAISSTYLLEYFVIRFIDSKSDRQLNI